MEEIAGYRVVRVVRDDGARRVLAAFGDVAVELHVASGDDAAALAAEAAVLLSVPHPHLAPVLDVATVGDVVAVVRPRPAISVTAWLLARGAPQPGEVVTVVAPVLEAVAALHGAGATAGRVDLHAIVLDDDGAPSLVGVGARFATRRPTTAWRESDAGVAADCDELAALIAELLAACGEHVPEAVRGALEARDADAAARALLATWPAVPVEHAHEQAAPVASRTRTRTRVRDADRASVVVRWSQAVLAQLSAVRKPVWIAAGAGAAALVLALALGGANASTAVEVPASDAPAPAADAAPIDATPAPTGMPPAEAVAIDAAAHLLAAREACLEADDDACLAGIVDPTGGATASTWRLPVDAAFSEVAVLGDAVLVDVASSSEPASILVVRTDAGWMLRDAWAA